VVEDAVTHFPELVEILLRILRVTAEPALEQPTRPPIRLDHVTLHFVSLTRVVSSRGERMRASSPLHCEIRRPGRNKRMKEC
jgi:hypothetical protein